MITLALLPATHHGSFPRTKIVTHVPDYAIDAEYKPVYKIARYDRRFRRMITTITEEVDT